MYLWVCSGSKFFDTSIFVTANLTNFSNGTTSNMSANASVRVELEDGALLEDSIEVGTEGRR
eukprot:SAG31_NODE_924_length_10963_cov_4.339286_7_plen_62_part_00